MLIDLSCPVENCEISVKTNSETGEYYLSLKLFNISEKIITSLSYNVKSFDENGTELFNIPVILDEISVSPKDFFTKDIVVDIPEGSKFENLLAEVTQATFEDGEIYVPSDENTVDCDDSEASINDALALRELIPEAICFSNEYDNYWRCPCGRANFLDSEACVRCGRDKDAMLTNFSSKTALENTIKVLEDEEAERLLKLKEEKELKIKKIKKNIIKTIIAIVILALVVLLGFLARFGIVSLMGNSAAKNGDYLRAYDLYSKIGSSKVADVMGKAMGNTPSNLMFGSGFVAEDDENIYYIIHDAYTQSANLIKENKETKEKTILTDSAYSCMNVVGDYIYFINNEGKPSRMPKDGSSTEILLEVQTYYICVVGNDIYYIKTDFDNPEGLSEEEVQTLAAQGQIESYTRLHKYNINTKKDTLVSTEAVNLCSIYGNRIYYLTPSNTEDTWEMSKLKSMNLKGKDVKTIVDIPVTSFAISGDELYYIPYFDESLKGSEVTDMSSLDCSIVKLNVNTGEKTIITDKTDMVLDINSYENSVFFVTYNREELINFSSNQAEGAEPPKTELKVYDTKTNDIKSLGNIDFSSFNVYGENIFCMLTDGSMGRLKTDGSDLEKISADGTTTPFLTKSAEAEAETEAE